VADLGIAGENILLERRARVQMLVPLGFGGCKLMISVPQRSKIRKISDLKENALERPIRLFLNPF